MLGAVIAAIGIAAALAPPVRAWEENLGLDLLFQWRGPRPAPSEAVVVAIETTSAERLRLAPDPARWPRSLHARLTQQLQQAGASVIGFDMFFQEARAPESDAAFAEAIGKAGNVVLLHRLEQERMALGPSELALERLVPPLPALAENAAALAPFPLPKVPVKVSQAWTFKASAGDAPTLPAVMFQLHVLPAYGALRQHLLELQPALTLRTVAEVERTHGVVTLMRELRDIFRANPRLAPTLRAHIRGESPLERQQRALIRFYERADDSFYLNFYGRPLHLRALTYYDALHTSPEALDLRGKAVFVGFAEKRQSSQRDGFYTVYSEESGLDISGVEIAATAFANLLHEQTVEPLSVGGRLIIVALFGLVLGALCRSTPALVAIPVGLGVSTLYVGLAYYCFAVAAVWWPLVVPLLLQLPLAVVAAVSWRYYDGARERAHIRQAFGHYLPARVVDEIAQNVGKLRVGPELVDGVCLATDAAQYTALAERLDPRTLSALMNDYCEAVFEPIHAHGGVISNVVGDAVLAVWAEAHDDREQRQRACLAAHDIRRVTEAFSQARGVALLTRVGVHAGEMLLGNVGAGGRYEYRAVGDIVNTATRIQDLNKHLGTHILVSRAALAAHDNIVTRPLGEFLLAGKSAPVEIHEIVCDRTNHEQALAARLTDFADGLAAFRARRWEKAVATFNDFGPHDGAAKFFAALAQRYLVTPPPEDWLGVISINKHGVVS